MAPASPTPAERESAKNASHVAPLVLLALVVLFLHAPFLNRAVQSDDVNYLDLASNALRRPLAPHDLAYVFQGKLVDMAGHPHPPLNAYLLAALWKIRGGFSERFFHSAYLVFPLLTALAAYWLAARFTRRPLLAALLLATAPVVQVISHSLESDSPTLALGLAGITLFIYGVDGGDPRKMLGGGVALALAALGALQALFLLPVAALYLHMNRPAGKRLLAAAAACALPVAVLGAWQLLQAAMLGRLPAAVLGGYLASRGYLGATLKYLNFLALTQHAAVLALFLPVLLAVFWRRLPRGGVVVPLFLAALGAWGLESYRNFERVLFFIFFAAGLMLLAALARLLASRSAQRDTRFLCAWFLMYFAACLAAFFAGAARYLLLGLPPLVLALVRELEGWPPGLRRALAGAALAGNLALGLALAHADYQFAAMHRAFARDFRREFLQPGEPFLFNGEWGFRYYMGALGGRIVWERSVGQPGELMVSSRLALGADHDSPAEELAVPVATRRLSVRTPLRLIDAIGDSGRPPARAGFLSVSFGVLPFSFSRAPLDEIRIARLSPLPALLERARIQPPDAAISLTQTAFPEGRRLLLRQQANSQIAFPIPPGWKRLRGALFARGAGAARFSIALDGVVLMDMPVAPGSDETAWAPFVVELPARSAEQSLALRVQAPPGMTAGWGGVLAE